MDWLGTAIKIFVELVRGWLSEFSRDKGAKDAGEAQAAAAASNAALDRAEGAQKNADEISSLDDDALDKRMRDNRDRILKEFGETAHKEIKGCEWSKYIGPSDATLKALRKAQDDKENYTDAERQQIRKDRERIATQDQNWIDNCL